ncbi:hypothetical protein [Sediminibacterium sp. KACHI17]
MLSQNIIQKIVFLSCFLLCFTRSHQLFAQVKIGTNPTSIAKSSILELESTSQGLLLPRITDTAAINTLNPPDGTLIYLANTNPGLYIRKGGFWLNVSNGSGRLGINFQSNPDGSLTIIYSDGTTFTTQKLVGETGPKGDKGDKGDKGETGIAGKGVKDIRLNEDSTLTIHYTDDTQTNIPQRVIAKDGLNGMGIYWKGMFDAAPAEAKTNWAYYDSAQHKSFIYDGQNWQILSQDGIHSKDSSLASFYGDRPITASVFNGQNPGTNDLVKWIEYLFYPSQGPTAGLTITYGSNTGNTITIEKIADGADLMATMNWEAGRQASTKLLSAITVAGDTVAFTQPHQNASVTGIANVSVPRNVNSSFTIRALTEDNKAATSTVNFRFLWKRYYGFVSTSLANEVMLTPTNKEILDLSSEFASARGFTKTVNPGSPKRLVIAYPLSMDSNDMEIKISGFDQKGAFDRQVIKLVNESGGSTDYVVYTAKNNTSAGVTFSVL